MKRLYRSKSERMIAGVCGGIAEYFFIDPVIVRAAFVLLGLMNGIGVILYIALAIITPEEGEREGTVSGADAIPDGAAGPAPTAQTPPLSPEILTLKRQRQLFLLLIVIAIVAIVLPMMAFFSFIAWIF